MQYFTIKKIINVVNHWFKICAAKIFVTFVVYKTVATIVKNTNSAHTILIIENVENKSVLS